MWWFMSWRIFAMLTTARSSGLLWSGIFPSIKNAARFCAANKTVEAGFSQTTNFFVNRNCFIIQTITAVNAKIMIAAKMIRLQSGNPLFSSKS